MASSGPPERLILMTLITSVLSMMARAVSTPWVARLNRANLRIQPGSTSSRRNALEENSSGNYSRSAQTTMDSRSFVTTASAFENATNHSKNKTATPTVASAPEIFVRFLQ